MTAVILSHIQARPLLEAYQQGNSSAVTSLDLGITSTTVTLHPTHLLLPNGQQLSWQQMGYIVERENACYQVIDGELELTIDGQTQLLEPGDIYIIPGGVEHSAKTGLEPTRVMDVFSPVREEYKY